MFATDHRFLEFTALGGIASGDVIYVDTGAQGNKTERSWQDAPIDLQVALKRAKYGDEVWVVQGRYVPTSSRR